MGVGAGAGAGAGASTGAGTGAGTGAVLGVGGAAVGAGAVAFAVNTGENCGGPVFFDGFVFCRAFLPVAWSFASRSRRAGEPLLILVDGDAAFLPGGVGRGIVTNVSCLPWLPQATTLRLGTFQSERANPSVSIN